MSELFESKPPRTGKQIVTALSAAFALTLVCCGGGIVLGGSGFFSSLATLPTVIGFVAFLFFIGIAIYAAGKALFGGGL
jgi:hypothetical protein